VEERKLMALDPEPIETLLDRAAGGDVAARQQLVVRHRQRLRQMIAVRMDPRLGRRLDPSDVVQEVLTQAWQELDDYLQARPLPFYPWLRQLAWQRLVKLHRHHIRAKKRSVDREAEDDMALSGASVLALADRLLAKGASPSSRVVREEIYLRVREALERLPERDRELLVMRYLEQLSTHEIAAILGVSDGAMRTRHVRAMERLRDLLDPQWRRGKISEATASYEEAMRLMNGNFDARDLNLRAEAAALLGIVDSPRTKALKDDSLGKD
jgi:RNA polymerase sigma-70 factor (ECF subfamily)